MQFVNARAPEWSRAVGLSTSRAVFAIAALSAAACSDAAHVSSPDVPPAPALGKGPKGLPTRGPLLFASAITGNRELYSVREDGSNLKRLTFALGTDNLAAFSPDGSKIAFISDRNGSIQMYVMNSDGTGVKQISSFTDDFKPFGLPAWSPDGKKLAIGLTQLPYATGSTDIFLMSLNGTGFTRLTFEGSINADPSFSPDGKRVAFHSNRDPIDGEMDLWVVDLDGTNLTRLTNCEAGVHCRRAHYSPDGTQIAYETASQVGESVVVMNVATKQPAFFTATGFNDPFWSPDGVKLAMVYNDGVTKQLRTVNTNGTGSETVIELSDQLVRGLSWGR